MKPFRYDMSGQWFKGNVHLHSTASDGGETFAELAERYAAAGYHFLFRTDHWVASNTDEDGETYPLLWLDGVELDGRDEAGAFMHVVCLGRVTGVTREAGLAAGLRTARRQGALLVLAHPHWCATPTDACARWNFDGVEVYNHVCRWLNGKSGGLVHWDVALMHDPNVLALSVDDAHVRAEHPGWNGGWIVVRAPACSADEIMGGIRRGNFYSSCGPEFRSIAFDGSELHLATSPVQFVRLVGPGPLGLRVGSFGDGLITEVDLPVPEDWAYAYVEIEARTGRRAWTNSLFVQPG